MVSALTKSLSCRAFILTASKLVIWLIALCASQHTPSAFESEPERFQNPELTYLSRLGDTLGKVYGTGEPRSRTS